MGDLPVYNQLTQRSRPSMNYRESAAVPAGAFGQGVGRTLSGMGALWAKRATELRVEDDTKLATDAYHAAKRDTATYLYGNDQSKGITGLTGNDALGVSADSVDALNSISAKHSENLNPRAGAIYNDMYGRYRSQVDVGISKFESGQRAVARKETVDEAQRLALEDVGQNPFEDEVEAQAMLDVETTMRLAGYSDEDIAVARNSIRDTRDENLLSSIIKTQPLITIRALNDNDGEFADRSVEWKEEKISEAEAEYERQTRARLTAIEVQRKKDKRIEDELREDTANIGIEKMHDGTLTESWLLANEPHLSTTNYKMLFSWFKDRYKPTHTDPMVYSEISAAAAAGENINQMVFDALGNNQITIEHRNQLIAASKQVRHRGAREFMRTQIDVSQDSARKSRMAYATADLDTYIIDNPDATRNEVMEKASSLARRAILFDVENIGVFDLSPDFVHGSLETGIDWIATYADTDAHFQDKHDGDEAAIQADPAFERQNKRLLFLKHQEDQLKILMAEREARGK